MRVSGCNILLGLASVLLIMMIVGCGGGGGGGGSDTRPTPINHAPTAAIVSPSQSSVILDVKSSQSIDFTIQADDSDGGNLTCFWTWDAGYAEPEESTVAAGSNSSTTFTPPSYDGSCTLRATVSDGKESASVSWTIQVTGHEGTTNQLRITAINVIPDPAQPSSTASVTASVENPGGNPLTYTWKTKYGSFSGTGSSVTWNTPSSAGAYGLYLSVSDGTYTVSAGKAVTVSGASGGLLGEYYKTVRDKNVVQLVELRLTRVDPNVNFFWEKLSPDPENFSTGDGWGARWTGFVKCEQAGTYVFRAHVDDGARMKVQDDSGQWVWVMPNDSANWNDHTEGAWLPDPTVPLVLDGGKWYPIQLEYFEGGGDAFITLYWSVNGGPEDVIPQSDLMPPS